MNYPEWEQNYVLHCPELKCKGMLLTHPFYHEYKCSGCGKYFITATTFIETKEPKRV